MTNAFILYDLLQTEKFRKVMQQTEKETLKWSIKPLHQQNMPTYMGKTTHRHDSF